MMRTFMTAMGVKIEDMSPFSRNFTFIRDLCDTFIRYCPNNFPYEGVVGWGLPDPTVNLEADGSDIITSYHVIDKIRQIVSDLLY